VRAPQELTNYVVPLPRVCSAQLPPLVPTYDDSAVVPGIETRSILDIPAEVDFDFFWDLEVPFRVVILDSPYGEAAVKRANLTAVLSVLKK
jgi:hypothetical protein